MNIHVSNAIVEKYPTYEFRGTTFNRKNRTLIEAYHKTLEKTFYYSFEEDFFWFGDTDFPDWMIKTK